RLTRALDRLGGALARQAVPLDRALAAGRQTTDVLAGRETALRTTVEQLPATLRTVRTTMDEVQLLSGRLDPALRALRPATRALPSALRDLDASVPEARRLVAEVDRT